MVGGIMVLPEAVMNAVRAHFNEHEEVPVFFRDPFFHEFKAFLGHCVNLTQQILFILCAKIWHVHQVFADCSVDLLHDGSRISVGSFGILRRGGKETSYLDTIDGFWWICLGNANRDDFLASTREDIPHA